MRAAIAPALSIALLAIASRAGGDPLTVLLIRNQGTTSARAQVALGVVAPCDSAENRVVFDAVVAPGAVRALSLNATMACARNATSWGDTDWTESRWIYGGLRCRSRFSCVPDSSVPMVFDFAPD